MEKIYISANFIYKVSESGNEDKPLVVTRPYRRYAAQWQSTGEDEFKDAGMFIKQRGGVDQLLAECIEVENLDAWVAEQNVKHRENHDQLHAAAMEREARWAQEAEDEYRHLFCNEVTETNEATVHALLRYLNTQNWGGWSLPKMTIGYECHQYDCDGKTATTIKLDEPIMVCGEMGKMFQYGAPHGHLIKYRRI